MPEIDIILKAQNQASGPIKQVNTDLGNLDKTATQASKGSLSQLAGAIGTGLKVAGVAGVTALAGLGVAVGVAGTNFNNMRQQAEIAFTTMLKDGNKAKVFLDDLQGFAASTPFEFPELLAASQRLLAMGFAAEEVKPTLTAVGDAVAGLGGSSEMVGRVTTALGQMQAKGKASSEEMMQLTEAGIPGWKFLADAIGTDVAGAMEQVTKGAVSSDVAISALVAGMNSQFGGMMEQQSKTFGGLFSTIKDTFTQVSGQVTEPFFEMMTNGLAAIVEWTSSEAFTGGVEKFTRMVELAAQAIGVFFGDMKTGESIIDSLTHALAYLLPPSIFLVWKDFAGAVEWLGEKFSGLMDVIRGDADALTYFRGLWAEVWGNAKGIFDGIVQWLGAQLPTFIATVYKWATALVDWIAEAAPKAINALTDFVRGIRTDGDNAGGQFSTMAGGWATKLWRWIVDDLIPKVGPAFMDFIQSLLNYGQAMLTALGGLAVELGKTLWQWIVNITPIAVDKLKEWGSKLWGWVESNTPEWIRKLSEWATAAWEWIADMTLPALKKLSDWGKMLWDWVADHAPDWYDKLKVWGAKAWQWITDIAIPEAKKKLGEWGAALWNWVTENAPKWYDKLKEWGNMAWEWIRDVAIPGAVTQLDAWGKQFTDWVTTNAPIWKEKLLTLGQNIVDGLRAGIEQKWGELRTWWKGTAIGMFIDDFQDMFGIHSPSRVMWGFGQDIMAGLQGGIHSGVDGLKSEMAWVAEQIKSSMAIANAEMLAATEYFTQQAAIKAEAFHYKIRQAAVDTSNLVKQLGLDPSTMPKSMGGTGKVVGIGPNGELIMEGSTNLPSKGTKPAPPAYAGAQKMLDAMNNWISFTTKTTDPLNDFLQEIKGLIVYAPNNVQQGIDTWLKTWKASGDPLNDYFDTAINLVKGMVTEVAAAIPPDQTIKDALGGISGSTIGTSIELLGGITLSTIDLAAAKTSADAAAATNQKTLDEFLGGISSFLEETLSGAKGVFSWFNLQESKAKAAGTLQQFINSEVYQTKAQLQSMYGGLQQSVADILGISSSELNVTGAGSLRLIDRIKQIAAGTTGGTDMDFIQQLLQGSVNFRTLSNYATPGDYFGSVLPTNTGLTGGNTTTNEFNITMQGGDSSTTDVVGLVGLLNSLYGTAA
jgi:tape measure domain-containing protein